MKTYPHWRVLITILFILAAVGFGMSIGNPNTWANEPILGGDGDDNLKGTKEDDVIKGGLGNDRLRGKKGDDDLYGGAGDDWIIGEKDDDKIFPGSGGDWVRGGIGDDQVTLFDMCEVDPGKKIDGGQGYDKLIVPVPLSTLQAMGMTVTGFEEIIVDNTQACESDCTKPCSRVLSELAGLPDPETWSVEPSSGLRYRRLTVTEREANGFPEGTFWVEDRDKALINALNNGTTPTIPIIIPVNDSTARAVFLGSPLNTINDIERVEREFVAGTTGQVVTRYSTPTIRTYSPLGFDPRVPNPVGEAFFSLQAAENEFYGEGVVGGREVFLNGTNWRSYWLVGDVPTPGDAVDQTGVYTITVTDLGQYGENQWSVCVSGDCNWICANTGSPCVEPESGDSPKTHCSDGSDNDFDSETDLGDAECVGKPSHCAFHDAEVRNSCWGTQSNPSFQANWESGKSFALFGEGQFCSGEGANWFTKLFTYGRDADSILTEATPGNFPSGEFATGGELGYRMVAAGCWIFPGNTVQERILAAKDCNHAGNCGSFNDADLYPYTQAGTIPRNYYGRVWNDVHHGVTKSDLKNVLHIAQVVYRNDKNTPALICSEDSGTCCGIAPYTPDPRLHPTNFRGSSLSQLILGHNDLPIPNCNIKRTVPHEIAHSLGVDHDNVTFVDGSPPLRNFMWDGSVEYAGQLDEFWENQLIDCLTSWDCPRPGGFRNDQDTCILPCSQVP